MNQNSSNVISAILWPFGALVSALKNWRQPWAMNVFWVVCIYMSFIHIYCPAGDVLGDGADIGRYVLRLQNMYQNSSSLQDAILVNGKPDIYQPVVTYFVSRLTGEGHILYLIFGLVFGFFYSRNVWYILDKIPHQIPKCSWILIAMFFLVCPIWNVSGVRMWTALHVFAYGALQYLWENNNKKLIWCAVTPFIHFSFMLPLAVIVMYWVIPSRIKQGSLLLKTMFVLYVATSFLNIFDIQTIGSYIERIAPNLFENNIAGYLGDEYVQRINDAAEAKSLLFKINSFVSYSCTFFMTTWAFSTLNRKDESNSMNIRAAFSFGLLMYSIANILAIVPSGGRYITIAQMFVTPALLLCYTYNAIGSVRNNITLVLKLYILPILFSIRIGCESYGYNLVAGNFIWGLLIENNISLITIIQNIL